ncbi:alkene reductase [Actinomadura formosensis]|uniref:alkene reductase n=1 Tax=Actinomadura formosensis TaxID=60706 RepID=UPI00082D3037|nr:alkene reductase [Actinomadura formosensis]
MSDPAALRLFTPLELRGGIPLANRVVMAPMTRARASEPEGIPSPEAAAYYAQRASAGLIVTEATNISLEGKGYSQTPGCHTDEQERAWAEVASAVHGRGGRIVMQLWHVGRLACRETSRGGPVAPSRQTAPASVWVARPDGWTGTVQCDEARALDVADIRRIVGDFRDAAVRAVRAGFDGVELHGANGYLIDQFLRATTNRRTDAYGGGRESRGRFLREVVEAVADAIGEARVGLRVSPRIGYADADDPEMTGTLLRCADWLDEMGIAYLHLAEADASFDDLARPDLEFRKALRDRFTGPIAVAHQYDVARAEEALESGLADLVAFGRPFIANPDLVERMATGTPLASADRSVWYGGGAAGYTDFPVHDA